MMRRFLFCVLALFQALMVGAAVEWRNLDDAHRLSGRKLSSGYLQGKVVLVDRWGAHCPPCCELLPRLEQIWQSFRSRPFVLLGGHCEGWGTADEVKALAREKELTYPIYEGAGLAKGEPHYKGIPFLYVVDPTGKVIYKGHSDRTATDVLVSALTDYASPRNLEQWKRYLDYEIMNLPGKAMLRYADFKKKFPQEAKAYESQLRVLSKLPNAAKLMQLVKVSAELKDSAPKTEADRKRMPARIHEAIRKYSALKDSTDPLIAQEAKNAIADLMWAEAEYK